MAIRQRLLHACATGLLLIVMVSLPSNVAAQADTDSSLFGDALKGTVLDPTTYAPALISYDLTIRDWNTSQPFFQNGFVEHNARFTVSGLPYDTAISYRAGRNIILKDALATLGTSAAYNLSGRLIENTLVKRYPRQRKIVRTAGWIGRISLASVMSYHLSAAHYRQWRKNQELAAQMGF